MQAIQVKWLPPTDTKGGRFKAFCKGGSVVIDQRSNVDYEDDEWRAAFALFDKLGWEGILSRGVLPNEDAVFVVEVAA